MTRHFDSVMGGLRADILRMGGLCEAILDKALRSTFDRNAILAAEVAGDDVAIDRIDVELDEGVLKALALQAPVAMELRTVLAVKMVATDLERVGDLARNIAKSASRISAREDAMAIPAMLISLSRSTQAALRKSLDAFGRSDAVMARAVLDEDDVIDSLQDEVVLDVLRQIERHPEAASRDVDMIMVAKNLERVADHATNIAEQVILVAEAKNVKHASKLAAVVADR